MQTSQFNSAETNKASIVNASEANKILAQMMDQETRKQLADIEASYKVLMQTEASAMSLYQASVKNISEILMNPDLTPEAKSVAVANQNQLLETGLQITAKISGLNLDSLLIFPSA
jgi:gamma-glutamylcysteine synthetase